jgi:hypothetical protein
LLPGGASIYANYTNYARGLNGVIIDISNLPATTTDLQILASLQFAQWNGISAAGFSTLPGAAVPSATILSGVGSGGSSRVKITFPDNALQNTWLRVTVMANLQTALAADDVFYFGNVIGELNFGNTATRLRVNGQDTNLILSNQSAAANSAPVTNIYDLDRNGRVNGQDTNILLTNQQAGGIVAPITVPALNPPAARRASSIAAPLMAAPSIATASPGVIKDSLVAVSQIIVVAKSAGTTASSIPSVTALNEVVNSGQGEVTSNSNTRKTVAKDASQLESVDKFFATIGRKLVG